MFFHENLHRFVIFNLKMWRKNRLNSDYEFEFYKNKLWNKTVDGRLVDFWIPKNGEVDRKVTSDFRNFVVKFGLRIWNSLKKVGPFITFSWITLKFQIFSWDKYTFSESLGSKLVKNYHKINSFQLSPFFRKIKKNYFFLKTFLALFRKWNSFLS